MMKKFPILNPAFSLLLLVIVIGVGETLASDDPKDSVTFVIKAPARFQFGDRYSAMTFGKLPSSEIWTRLVITDSKYRIVIPWAREGGKKPALAPPVELAAGQEYRFTFRRDLSGKGVYR